MERGAVSDWQRWGLGIVAAVVSAAIIGLGSTAWELYNRVHGLEKELIAAEAEVAVVRHVNEAQQKEIDRLWDSLTELWSNASDAVQ